MGSSVSANPSRLSLASNCWQLASGRTLAYEFYGDPSGEPVIYFHSHTSSRLAGSYFHASALQNGIRLISIDRPGTGRSDYVMQENLSDFSRDVIELADQLELAEFGLLSWSSGAPYAFTTAHEFPQRSKFLVSMATTSLNIYDRKQAGQTSLSAHFCELATLLSRVVLSARYRFFAMDSLAHIERLRDQLCYSDRKILSNKRVLELIEKDLKESARQGVRGMAQDIRLGTKPLEFDLGELAIPVHIWQGSADTLVPRNYSERLVEMISGAQLHRVAHRGHFFIMQFMDEVFSSLSAPGRIRNSVSSLISRDSLVLRKSA